MGVSYRPDNPFAATTSDGPATGTYRPDNPFAPKDHGPIDLRTPSESTAVTRRPASKATTSPDKLGNGGGVLSGLAQGGTLGFADEVLAGIDAADKALEQHAPLSQFGANYRATRDRIRGLDQGYAKEHPVLHGAAELVGSLPTILATGGASEAPDGAGLLARAVRSVPAQGAKYGAIQGAGSANELSDVPSKSVLGAVLGGVSAKGSELLGRGAANVSDRLGLTDAIGAAVSRVSPKLASTIGTNGQVNRALTDRQDILDALGDPGQTAAKTQLDRIAATKARAATLYGAARSDTRPLQDAELNQLLADPQIQKAYQAAAELRAASGNPLPRTAAPEQIPAALQAMGTTPEAYARLNSPAMLKARGISNTGTDILPAELSGAPAKGVDLPDPDVLAKTKRYLWDAANGRQNSPLAINQDEARALLPKVDAIRQKLHEVSPAWKDADAFYADAKGQEEAFAHGFDAFRLSKNPTGDQLATHSPEAMQEAISTPRYPGEPPEAMVARADAFREGVRAAAAADVRRQPVDKGARSILTNTKSLAPTPAAAQTRSLMFDSPERSGMLEQLLGSKRGALAPADATGVPLSSRAGVLRSALQKVTTTPDLTTLKKGQSLLADNLRESVLHNSLDQFQQGAQQSELLKRLLSVGAGTAVAR